LPILRLLNWPRTFVKKPEIYCPLCKWRPATGDRWVCTRKIGGCGTSWNTFDTRGICPECSWQWHITQCRSCKQFSPHEAWYHFPEDPQVREKEREAEVEDA